MPINPSHLRPGNWIHCKGSSHYGVVTGDILAEMERDEKFREKFEYIELTGELLEAAGFVKKRNIVGHYFELNGFIISRIRGGSWGFYPCAWGENGLEAYGKRLNHLHEAQNVYFDLTGSELCLPESAKLIPEKVNL